MRVNIKKQRYLRFFGTFPLRGRGMTVYPSGRVVRDRSLSSSLSVFTTIHPELCRSCFRSGFCRSCYLD